MERLFKSGGIDPEFKWVQKTEEAAQDFESGNFTAAADKWETAHRFIRGLDAGDPRRASSLNNLAIAFRIRQNFREAEDLYQSALQGWQAGLNWVKSMNLRQRARSSLFHLRMELKHRKQYNDMARRKYEELLRGGRAGTLNNLAELNHNTDRGHVARRLYREALRECPDSMPEQGNVTAIIQHNLSRLSEMTVNPPDPTGHSYDHLKESMLFISKAEQNGWIVDKPPEFTDEGRLMAAILLVHLIDHTYLSSSEF